MPRQRATRSEPHMAYDNTLHPQQDNLGCGRTQSFPHAPSIRRGGQDEKEEQKEWTSWRTLGKNGNKGWPDNIRGMHQQAKRRRGLLPSPQQRDDQNTMHQVKAEQTIGNRRMTQL